MIHLIVDVLNCFAKSRLTFVFGVTLDCLQFLSPLLF
jgi:hypothetical protein